MTRLIKLSKNQKSTRDSFIGTLGSSASEASQISLNSFTSPGPSPSKLGAAQSELHACEAHLAAKEKALDELRVSAVRRGLEARCKAMVECGWNWGEMGKEGLRALEGIDSSSSAPNGTDGSFVRLLSHLFTSFRVSGVGLGFRLMPSLHSNNGCLDRSKPVAPVRRVVLVLSLVRCALRVRTHSFLRSLLLAPCPSFCSECSSFVSCRLPSPS